MNSTGFCSSLGVGPGSGDHSDYFLHHTAAVCPPLQNLVSGAGCCKVTAIVPGWVLGPPQAVVFVLCLLLVLILILVLVGCSPWYVVRGRGFSTRYW